MTKFLIMHQGSTSHTLLKFDIFVSWFFKLWVANKNGMCYVLTMFFWRFTNNMNLFSTIQTKIVYTSLLLLLLHENIESCFINLHGLSFNEVAIRWGRTPSEKLLCVGDVSQWFSCQYSKNMLSNQTCAMAWLKFERSNMVNSKYFIVVFNPNWN
jgi:hypothetical protein